MVAIVAVSLASCCNNQKGDKAGTLTGSLDDAAWQQSEWISAADAPVVTGTVNSNENERAADGASWFVTEITNVKKVKKAVWMTAGLGVYRLFLNGKEVGEEFLKPGFTHYAKTKISFTYDITDAFLKAKGGLNCLSAQVTPGWWADKIITPKNHEGMIGDKPAFRSVLQLVYADGSSELFGTNCSDWKAGIAGPVTHADIFDGEEYDARIPEGYLTPEKLSTPELNNEFAGKIFPTAGAEVYIRRDLALSPVRAYVWKDIEGKSEDCHGKVLIEREYAPGEEMSILPGEQLVVDFGQNCAGIPEFVFRAEEGTTLSFLPAELLNDGNGAFSRGMDGPEGSVHRLNLRVPDSGMRLVYTFAGGDDFVKYHPSCTFFGYRYASISADAPVRIRQVETLPVSSITAELETGSITTGNELVNKLISNTLWGQRSNYLSVPTDCPQRNERLGWTADTQVFAMTGSFFADTDSFFHKWTRDLRDTQTPTGAYPGVAPQAQYGSTPHEMMRLGWADAGIIVPWVMWRQFADTSIIDENWDSMILFIDHVNETRYDHTALAAENGNFQWGDWLSYEPLESRSNSVYRDSDPSKGLLPEAVEYWNYLGACYWAMDAGMMAQMAKVTGRPSERFEKMEAEAKAYLKSRFLLPDGSFKLPVLNTMQTPALFALKNDLVEGKAKENMVARLRKNFEDHDNCLQTGFLGTSILMQTLSDNGMTDIAYELLFQHKNPSWMYSIDNGATTIWERWNSYTLANGMGPKEMNSFNHYAYGCVCEWIWQTCAGIASCSSEPGFKHIVMKPVPDRRLGSLKAEYKSAAGLVTSQWEYKDNIWEWKFSIPEGCTASVSLPDGSEPQEFGSGYHILRIEL